MVPGSNVDVPPSVPSPPQGSSRSRSRGAKFRANNALPSPRPGVRCDACTLTAGVPRAVRTGWGHHLHLADASPRGGNLAVKFLVHSLHRCEGAGGVVGSTRVQGTRQGPIKVCSPLLVRSETGSRESWFRAGRAEEEWRREFRIASRTRHGTERLATSEARIDRRRAPLEATGARVAACIAVCRTIDGTCSLSPRSDRRGDEIKQCKRAAEARHHLPPTSRASFSHCPIVLRVPSFKPGDPIHANNIERRKHAGSAVSTHLEPSTKPLGQVPAGARPALIVPRIRSSRHRLTREGRLRGCGKAL